MTLKEQQQQAERRSYELRISDVPLQRNPLNGRFLKGHTPANKGKKWSEYLSKRKQKRCAKGWENLKKHRVKGGPGRPKKPVIAVNETGKWLYLSSCKEAGRLLGVGVRTMVRKARELGLEKDGEWLSRMWRDHVRMAHMMSRALGYPGRIMPGEHRNPDGEYKAGRVHSEEDRRKISEGNRRNWMLHRRERRAKIRRTRGLDDEEKTAFVS